MIRRYLGDRTYKIETIAEADDVLDANGEEVLDPWPWIRKEGWRQARFDLSSVDRPDNVRCALISLDVR